MYRTSFEVTESVTLKDGSTISIGQSLALGATANQASDRYQTVFHGKFPSVANQLAGVIPQLANTTHQGMTYVVSRIKIYRSFGKITLNVEMVDPELDMGVFGKAHVWGTGLSIEKGEIVNPNAPLTRAQAIAKLKEAKDLLDLDLMSQAEYDVIKAEVTSTITK